MTYPVDLPNPPDLEILRAKSQTHAEIIAGHGEAIDGLHAEDAELRAEIDRIWGVIGDLPTEPEPPEPPIDPPIEPPSEIIEAGDVNVLLARGEDVILPNGSTVLGTIYVSSPGVTLTSTGIATIETQPGEDGIVINAKDATGITIENLNVVGPSAYGSSVGVKRWAPAKDGFFGDITLRNLFVKQYDILYAMVDQLPTVDPSKNGRLRFTMENCIGVDAVGDDAHSTGIRTDGLAEGCLLDRVRIARVGLHDRNKRSHCVYAAKAGAPLTVRDSWFADPAAKGLELRTGGDVENVVLIRCPQPIAPRDGSSRCVNILAMDSPDVADDHTGTGIGIEGWSMPSLELRNVLIARNTGSRNEPAVRVWSGNAVTDNIVSVDWGSIQVNDQTPSGSRVLADDPGIPGMSDSYYDSLFSSGRNQANIEAFISKRWEALN